MYTAYPTFQDIKHYLGISNYADDALLVAMSKSSVEIFENMCGRSFLGDTGVRYASADSRDVIRWNKLHLREEFLAITALEIDGVAVDTSEFYTDGDSVHLINDSSRSFREYTNDPHNTIKLTGNWGYMGYVPDDVFWAIVRLAAFLYLQKDNTQDLTRPVAVANAGEIPAALPADVSAVADYYRRLV